MERKNGGALPVELLRACVGAKRDEGVGLRLRTSDGRKAWSNQQRGATDGCSISYYRL